MEYLEGSRSKQDWVIEHFKDPKRVSPGSPMRAYAMNDEQIESLASYVLSLNQREFTRKFTPKAKSGFVPPRVDLVVREAALSALCRRRSRERLKVVRCASVRGVRP